MFKKMKNYFTEKKEYKDAKKALTILLLNKYADLLDAETRASEAEEKAYAAMDVFGDKFNPDDLQKLMDSVNKIASNPSLTTEYYKQVNKSANIDRQTDKVVKAMKK